VLHNHLITPGITPGSCAPGYGRSAAGHNQVQVAGLDADRAIAIFNLYIFIGFNFKFDSTTVAASLVEHDLNSALN
jgi:hypothetical protein